MMRSINNQSLAAQQRLALLTKQKLKALANATATPTSAPDPKTTGAAPPTVSNTATTIPATNYPPMGGGYPPPNPNSPMI